jgi:peptide chain release factor 1
MDFETQCKDIEENFKQLEIALTDQELLSDQDRYRETAKKHAELGRILEQWHQYSELQDSLEQAQGLLHDDDPDMVEMAREEVKSTEKQIESTEKKLMHLLLPKDPIDRKSVV